jgi:N6-L-threonylcarbamoyladenine synthase
LEKKFIKKEGFKDASQITTTRFFIYNALKKKYKNVHLTYGYITKNNRKIHKLEKSHVVDARCISGNPEAPSEYYYYLKNIRKNKE